MQPAPTMRPLRTMTAPSWSGALFQNRFFSSSLETAQSSARAGFDDLVQQVGPLKDHQRPHLVLGQGGIGLHSLGDGAVDVVGGLPGGWTKTLLILLLPTRSRKRRISG